MKKTILLIFTAGIFLCGCAKVKNNTELSLSAPQLVSEIGKAAALEATREYVPENPNSADILKNYYHIENPFQIEDFCILLPETPNVSEIAIFRFNTEEEHQIVLQAVRERYETIIALCETKTPAKLETARKALILQYENAVVLIVTPNHNEIIKRIIDNAAVGML